MNEQRAVKLAPWPNTILWLPQEQPPAEEEEPTQQDAPEENEEGGEADTEAADEEEEAKPEIVVRLQAPFTCLVEVVHA